MTEVNALSARLQKLEDLEAIRQVTAAYASIVDTGWNGKTADLGKLSTVFTDDIRWKCVAMNVDSRGLAPVTEMLKGASAGYAFAMHSFTNPIIEVRGDTASGHWLLWVAVKGEGGANEVFQSEALEYARTAAGWRIESIDLHFGAMLK